MYTVYNELNTMSCTKCFKVIYDIIKAYIKDSKMVIKNELI